MGLSAVWVAVLGGASLMEGCGAISCTSYDEFQVCHCPPPAQSTEHGPPALSSTAQALSAERRAGTGHPH